jgi:hypothetical protein
MLVQPSSEKLFVTRIKNTIKGIAKLTLILMLVATALLWLRSEASFDECIFHPGNKMVLSGTLPGNLWIIYSDRQYAGKYEEWECFEEMRQNRFWHIQRTKDGAWGEYGYSFLGFGYLVPSTLGMDEQSPIIRGVNIPLWFPASILGSLTTLFLYNAFVRRSRMRTNKCIHCGYDLRAIDVKVCPECGRTTEVPRKT